jgi:integrase
MRKCEFLSLKWDNLDLRHGFILLNHTKNGERREIPINQTLKDILKGTTRRIDVPYVFYDSNQALLLHNYSQKRRGCKYHDPAPS